VVDRDAVGAGGPSPLGGYTIRPGDTLTALARRSRVSVGQVAYMNGLNPRRPIRAGTLIKLPTGSPIPLRAGQPAPARRLVPGSGPYPTPARVSESTVRSIAAAHGVPPSLAAAIAWQESGFNNGLVSSANARGVMQLLPGTWDWVQRRLVGHRLDPRSPRANVSAGVLYLRSLLHSTGNNPATAAAAYYQGLGSVRHRGLLAETKRYVKSVRVLMSRFGRR
jgi:LysM repeat protein